MQIGFLISFNILSQTNMFDYHRILMGITETFCIISFDYKWIFLMTKKPVIKIEYRIEDLFKLGIKQPHVDM